MRAELRYMVGLLLILEWTEAKTKMIVPTYHNVTRTVRLTVKMRYKRMRRGCLASIRPKT